jgi:hypothetical protein
MSNDYVHWICSENPVEVGCGWNSNRLVPPEVTATATTSIEQVTCLQCRRAAERNLAEANATIEFENKEYYQQTVERYRNLRKPGPPWRASQVTLHAIDEKPAALVADAATAQQVEELGGRLMQAMVKEHVETQLAPPAPECADCKRWALRIKVLEERVEYAQKVLAGL